MKRVLIKCVIPIMLVFGLVFSGCRADTIDVTSIDSERPSLLSIIDYAEWVFDVDGAGTYNYVTWIELDIWCKERINNYDWTDLTYDVVYENQTIASNLAVVIGWNYIYCPFNNSIEGAILTDSGFLSPGKYEIIMKDGEGIQLLSYTCTVTTEAGDVLSEMVTGVEKLNDLDGQLALRIHFDGDITPYSRVWFYFKVSIDGGETYFAPENSSIEPASTYLTIRYFNPDYTMGKTLVSLYCGDGSFVGEWEV